MATKSCILAVYAITALTIVIFSAHAYEFRVGGRDGWVLDPKEEYNHWAQRMRFQVNDSLVFKYTKGKDSVMVVTKEDYEACNTTNPIKKMEDGNSVFHFDRSSSFFFISGNHERCQNGEKLWVIVMALRKPLSPSPSTSSPSPSPSPFLAPPPSLLTASEQAPNPSPSDETMTPSPSLSPSSSPAMDHSDVISILFITILFSSLFGVGWSELSCNINLGRVFSMLCTLLLDC